MLIRLYRVTDKFGVLAIQLIDQFIQHLLLGATELVRFILWVIYSVAGLFFRLAKVILSGVGLIGGLAGTRVIQETVRLSQASQSASTVMARRAQRSRLRQDTSVSQLIEDPLKTQNRILGYIILFMGFALLGVFLWATTPKVTINTGGNVLSPDLSIVQGLTPTLPTILNTPIPTATAIPSILEVRGSIAFVVREGGQEDIWAVNVGENSPVRVVNSSADDRHPAWSPDGRKLAYASRQDGNWEIYVYDLVSNNTLRLTYDLSYQGHPSWSNDGQYLVYESYQGENLDLYISPLDGSQAPIRITENPAPDFSPSWSPDGRRIVFTSLRSGTQDLYLFSLDDPRDEASINLTQTDSRNEDFASWSPNGELVAFSAIDEGISKVFVKSLQLTDSIPQVLERGEMPSWSPDGAGLVLSVDSIDSTHLIVSPFTQSGIATQVISVPSGSYGTVWTVSPLPVDLTRSNGLPLSVPAELYNEQVVEFSTEPRYRLDTLVDVDAPNPVLSDRVNDSFNALRERTLAVTGYDFLGQIEDAFWRIDRPPQPGEARRNWHMTGRAFAINRNAIAGFPPPIEVIREEIGVETFWRVYVRVAEDAQNGQLGEPLRAIPWDFASRNQGDVEAYDQGGRLRESVPTGYYVDFTELVADYGWERMSASSDWRANFNAINFWLFRKDDGLEWLDAMLELYTESQLGGFVPTPNP
ncbi:MAG: TolB family protein [Phototrophicaceae bacterium]